MPRHISWSVSDERLYDNLPLDNYLWDKYTLDIYTKVYDNYYHLMNYNTVHLMNYCNDIW